MPLRIPAQYRVVNWWDYIGEQAPEGFDPTDPTIVNATWLMENIFDRMVNGEFPTKSFNIVSYKSDLDLMTGEKGQTAYVLGDADYANSFFIYNGTSWINPIEMVEQDIETAKLNVDYGNLQNKPKINNVNLNSGNNTLSTLGIQGKNLYFTNLSASVWVSDSTYNDYSYKCEISCSGVSANMFAIVVFAPSEFDSGNYANVCLTGANTVTIYSKLDTPITVPTIVVMGE